MLDLHEPHLHFAVLVVPQGSFW